MGFVHTEITMKNAGDVTKTLDGIITETEVREITVKALVDTGAGTLVINEEVREALGLKIIGSRFAGLADGTRHKYSVTEPIDIHWKDRRTTCVAVVLPNAKQVLLGAVPLQDLDLMVNPVTHELIGVHGDEVLCLI